MSKTFKTSSFCHYLNTKLTNHSTWHHSSELRNKCFVTIYDVILTYKHVRETAKWLPRWNSDTSVLYFETFLWIISHLKPNYALKSNTHTNLGKLFFVPSSLTPDLYKYNVLYFWRNLVKPAMESHSLGIELKHWAIISQIIITAILSKGQYRPHYRKFTIYHRTLITPYLWL